MFQAVLQLPIDEICALSINIVTFCDAVRSVYTDCLEIESKSAQPKRFE